MQSFWFGVGFLTLVWFYCDVGIGRLFSRCAQDVCRKHAGMWSAQRQKITTRLARQVAYQEPHTEPERRLLTLTDVA